MNLGYGDAISANIVVGNYVDVASSIYKYSKESSLNEMK